MSIIDRVVGAECAEFLEAVEGVRVLLLSVSGDEGSGYGGSESMSVGGSDRPDDSESGNGKGVGARSALLGCFLVDCSVGTTGTCGVALIGILTAVRYCLGTDSATSTEFSRLLLEVLSPGNDVKGVRFIVLCRRVSPAVLES